jgi:uncharacterized protein
MNIKARQFLLYTIYCYFLFFPGGRLTGQEDSWKGPVRVPEFSFDVLDFYSIGWSEQGRMAYGVTFPDKGGGKTWQWFIQDLVDDRILYTSPRWTLMTGQKPLELWQKHPEWYSQLVRFDITPERTILKGEKTFRLDGASYSLEVVMDRSETADSPEGVTHEIAVRFYRNYNTAKAIYDYHPDPSKEVVDDMVLKGYIKNPNENRIAVIALEKSGPDSAGAVWKYRVFGAHLTVGFTPVVLKGSELAEAVLNGQYYVSRMFLENGADPEEKDVRGYTALLLAARRGLWDIALLLLNAGADPDVSDDKGRTPLHYAVEADALNVVSRLLERGADPDKLDSRGLSPRREGEIKGNPAIIREF